MIALRLALVLSVIVLGGCDSAVERQYRDAKALLRKVDQNVLIADGVALAKANKDLSEIPPEAWPESIRKLGPVGVRNYEGVWLFVLTSRNFGHQVGFMIFPIEEMPDADFYDGGNREFRQITPQLYWYAD